MNKFKNEDLYKKLVHEYLKGSPNGRMYTPKELIAREKKLGHNVTLVMLKKMIGEYATKRSTKRYIKIGVTEELYNNLTTYPMNPNKLAENALYLLLGIPIKDMVVVYMQENYPYLFFLDAGKIKVIYPPDITEIEIEHLRAVINTAAQDKDKLGYVRSFFKKTGKIVFGGL